MGMPVEWAYENALSGLYERAASTHFDRQVGRQCQWNIGVSLRNTLLEALVEERGSSSRNAKFWQNDCRHFYRSVSCHPDEDFAALWQQLATTKADPDTRLLRFRSQHPFPDFHLEWLGAIYARRCYKKLGRLVQQMGRADQPLGSSTPIGDKMIVTGTPGIGRTMWLLYLMWELAMKGKTVVFERDGLTGPCFLFTPSPQAHPCSRKDGPRVPGFGIRAVSGIHESRCLQARELFGNRTESQMRAAYGVWGGITSCMLWRHSPPNCEEPEEVASSDLLAAVKLSGGNDTGRPGAPPWVHMIPDAELNSAHYDVCSTRIAELAVDSAHAHETVHELQHFLENSGPAGFYAGIHASLWRPYVLRTYSKGSDVSYRDLQPPGSFQRARVGQATFKSVASPDEMKKKKSGKMEGDAEVMWRLATETRQRISSSFPCQTSCASSRRNWTTRWMAWRRRSRF